MRYRLSKKVSCMYCIQIENQWCTRQTRTTAFHQSTNFYVPYGFMPQGAFNPQQAISVVSVRQRKKRGKRNVNSMISLNFQVIGALDCTHIKLGQSPSEEAPECFRNREGFFSLYVKVICNANMEITDMVTGYPGHTHDSRIFLECRRRRLFEQGLYGNCVLVGDSGYASKRYMMVPLQECQTPAENLYNRTRNVVERTRSQLWMLAVPVSL